MPVQCLNSHDLLETSTNVSVEIALTAQSQPMVHPSPSLFTSNWRAAESRAGLKNE